MNLLGLPLPCDGGLCGRHKESLRDTCGRTFQNFLSPSCQSGAQASREAQTLEGESRASPQAFLPGSASCLVGATLSLSIPFKALVGDCRAWGSGYVPSSRVQLVQQDPPKGRQSPGEERPIPALYSTC